ncbi:MAG TPA: hypothetical protein VN622_08520 [Clostridia bacterium]|nr:hypothetical protein [Clostridia bacterium]
MSSSEFHYDAPHAVTRGFRLVALIGVILTLAGLFVSADRTWASILLVSYYLLALGLAGAVFIALQYVTGASWGVALRRIPEAMTLLVPIGGIGILSVLLLHPSLYPWSRPEVQHELPAFRHWWLGITFVRARAVLYLLIWIGFALALLRGSRKQDRDGLFAHTRTNVRISAAFLVAFAITFWLASVDWIMSLEPDFASTIFGMYNFAGLFVSGLAAMTLTVVWLQKRKPLNAVINRHHLHDCGKLMFAFSTFWMYLWFSQYMLIWYANLPEETGYYVQRLHGFWQPLFLLNLALNWVIPFFALLPKLNKQNAGVLTKVSLVLLAGRWLDLYLMIGPTPAGAQPRIGLWEFGCVATAVGLFGISFFRAFGSAPAVPIRDPYLAESVEYHA